MSVFHKESVKVSSIKKNNIFNEKTKFTITTSQCCIVLGLSKLRVKFNFTQLHRVLTPPLPHSRASSPTRSLSPKMGGEYHVE